MSICLIDESQLFVYTDHLQASVLIVGVMFHSTTVHTRGSPTGTWPIRVSLLPCLWSWWQLRHFRTNPGAAYKSRPSLIVTHDDVIKWKHFLRYWPFVRGIPRSPVNSPHKGQWRGALIFPLICTSINGWVNNREADDLRRCHAHYDVTVMTELILVQLINLDHLWSSSNEMCCTSVSREHANCTKWLSLRLYRAAYFRCLIILKY